MQRTTVWNTNFDPRTPFWNTEFPAATARRGGLFVKSLHRQNSTVAVITVDSAKPQTGAGSSGCLNHSKPFIHNGQEKFMSRERLEKLAAEGMEKLFVKVPKAREFHAGEWSDEAYYRRHLLETVLRIRLNNEVDAYGLYKVGYKDHRLAGTLAQYLSEENNHEGMFLRDLQRFGLTKADVDAIRPFPSTEYLMGYMYFSINQDGPLPTTVWNWFVEWYSDRYNSAITQHAAELYGSDMVKGSQAHIDYDESHDHDDLMWSTVDRAITGWGELADAERHLVNFIDLIGLYFTELYEETVGHSA